MVWKPKILNVQGAKVLVHDPKDLKRRLAEAKRQGKHTTVRDADQ